MPRRWRAAVFLAFSSAGVFFAAAATTVTAVPAAIWWAQEASATDVAEPSAELSPSPPLVVPTSIDQWFTPSGANRGTQGLVDYLSGLARHGNAPLAITSGWGRHWGSTESDHHASRADSWACDLAVPGVSSPSEAGDIAAQRLASALGQPGWTNGNLVVTHGGYRFQLLWRVYDHYDHVHIGVRKL